MPDEAFIVIGDGKAAVVASGVDLEHFTKPDRDAAAGVDDIDSFVRIV